MMFADILTTTIKRSRKTRQSKLGGFCVLLTETCEPWPYYDSLLLKNGVFIMILSMFHKMENTIIKIQTA